MFFSNAERLFSISTGMPKKVKYELDFDIGDRVFFITDDEDELPAVVTELRFTSTQVFYQVNRGFEEKWCQAFEIREAVPSA